MILSATHIYQNISVKQKNTIISADPSLRGSAPRRVFRRRSYLRLCLVTEVSQWLGHDFIVFRGSKRNVFSDALPTQLSWALLFRMRSRRSFLRLCLVAEVSQWLGHDFIVFRGSKRNVSRFLRLHSCSGWGTISLFLVGSKSDVSAFLRLQFRNGLDAKPAGALLFRMRSRRSFHTLCLVVLQWLRHDFIVFRGSKRNVSRFLRLQFRNGLDAKPAGALLFRMRSRRSFLRLCLVAEVSQWLGHDFIVFRGSKTLLQWLGRKTCWGSAFSDALPTQLSWALPGGCSFAVAGARFHCF